MTAGICGGRQTSRVVDSPLLQSCLDVETRKQISSVSNSTNCTEGNMILSFYIVFAMAVFVYRLCGSDDEFGTMTAYAILWPLFATISIARGGWTCLKRSIK